MTTNNKLNSPMTPSPWTEPGHIGGRLVLSPLHHPSPLLYPCSLLPSTSSPPPLPHFISGCCTISIPCTIPAPCWGLSYERWQNTVSWQQSMFYRCFISGEMQLHLQAMVNLLRDEDVLRLVRLLLITSTKLQVSYTKRLWRHLTARVCKAQLMFVSKYLVLLVLDLWKRNLCI